jgi:hypothetical protein
LRKLDQSARTAEMRNDASALIEFLAEHPAVERYNDRGQPVRSAELVEKVAHVKFDGLARNAKNFCNLGICLACLDPVKHFFFARGQTCAESIRLCEEALKRACTIEKTGALVELFQDDNPAPVMDFTQVSAWCRTNSQWGD